MLRSKRNANAILVMLGVIGVSSILTQCTLAPTAFPAQAAVVTQDTVAITEVIQTVSMTSFVPSATSTSITTTPTIPAVSSTPDAPILQRGGPRAATNLQSEVECAQPGLAVARLTWTPASNRGSAQRIDVTIYSFDTKFDSSVLLSPNENSLVWDKLKGQAIHNWRVLTLHADGWVPSETARFEGPTCIVEIEEEESPPVIK